MNGALHESDDLIQAHLDGLLTPEQHHAFNRRLGESPRLIQQLIEAARLEARIEHFIRSHDDAAALTRQPWLHGRAGGPAPFHDPCPKRGWRNAAMARFVAAAVIVGAIGGLMGLRMIWPHLEPRRSAGSAGAGAAVLADVEGAVWEQGEPAAQRTPGALLPPQMLRLRAGRITVEFDSGAAVTVQGPAEFGINSPMRGWLGRGTLRAVVPASARGFTIAAPGLAVMDLGTQFGIEVGADRHARIDVLEGLVTLQRNGQPDRDLRTREAVTVDGHSGRLSRAEFDPARFPSIPPGMAGADYRPGFVWRRRTDFDRAARQRGAAANPLLDAAGRGVWSLGYVALGRGEDAVWYAGPPRPLVWVEHGFGKDAWWASEASVGPLANRDRIVHLLHGPAARRAPVVRWLSPIAATVKLNIEGTLVVNWRGPHPRSATVVIARLDDAGDATPLLKETVEPPAEDAATPLPVRLPGVTVRPGQQIAIALRGSGGEQSHVALIDDLRFLLTEIRDNAHGIR